MSNRRNAIYILISVFLLIGLFTGRSIFFNLAYLLGGLFFLTLVWAWLAVRGLGVSRTTRARRAQVGRMFRETFRVTNRSILPKLWLEIYDHSTLPNHNVSHVISALGPRSTYQWRAETQCRVRGEFQLGPMTLVSGDPFGFFLMPRRINATERIIIYPLSVELDRFLLPRGVLSGGDAQRQFTQQVTTNAAGVREYVPGDSINRIHWRSTARRNKLIVKEFELDPMVDIWLFVDFSAQSLYESAQVQRLGGTGPALPGRHLLPESTEEYVAVIAASLTDHFIDSERALGFTTYAPDRIMLPPERGGRQRTRIMETLAIARSVSTRSLREMLSLETHAIGRGTSLIIVTSNPEPSWIIEAQILSRRGIRPTVVFVDPASFAPGVQTSDIQQELLGARLPHIIVRNNDDLVRTLSQPPLT